MAKKRGANSNRKILTFSPADCCYRLLYGEKPFLTHAGDDIQTQWDDANYYLSCLKDAEDHPLAKYPSWLVIQVFEKLWYSDNRYQILQTGYMEAQIENYIQGFPHAS